MSAYLDQTAFAGALKTVYSPDEVENLTYEDNPLHAMLRKYTEFYGDSFKEAIIWGNPQGQGVTIADAQAAKAPSSIAGFLLTRISGYFTASVANEMIEASKSDKGAFMKALTTEIDGGMRNLGRTLAQYEYGDGTGVLGTVATGGVSGSVITLKDINQITNFEYGMSLAFATDTTFGTYHGNATVANLDRNLGTITVSAIGTIAAGDVIVRGTGVTTGVNNSANSVITGLAGWLPRTAPGSTAFFGIDRSKDVVRLGGVRSNQVGVTLDEALINGARDVAREGGKPDVAFMDFLNWANLVKILGAQVRYIEPIKGAQFGFQSVRIQGPRGPIDVIPDRNCPSDTCFMLQLNTWCLRSLGMAPRLLDSDGNQILREATADNVEVRLGYRGQLGCSAPGFNANIQLA